MKIAMFINENVDILANSLEARKFTGDIIEVLADVTLLDVANMEANPYQKVQLTDEETGLTIQGWIMEMSTKPIGEALTNIRIIEAAAVSEIDYSMVWNSGETILWNDSDNIDWNK